jgi:hypothetical protein
MTPREKETFEELDVAKKLFTDQPRAHALEMAIRDAVLDLKKRRPLSSPPATCLRRPRIFTTPSRNRTPPSAHGATCGRIAFSSRAWGKE